VALGTPSNEDVRKIHAEVNQLVHQRFLLTNLAITVFGVMTAWLLPRTEPQAGSQIGAFVFAGSAILLTVLFLLFLFSLCLTRMLRVLTTYLEVTGGSNWEAAWKTFREDGLYLGYTKPQAIVFMVLGVLVVCFPVLLTQVYALELKPRTGFWLSFVGFLLYEFSVIIFGFFGALDNERAARERWERLKNGKSQPNTGLERDARTARASQPRR
jgi:predicted membrane channel-forming protein YqfA (hemolysin III family)